MRHLRSLSVLALALAARSAQAQGECPVDIYQPSALAQAGIRITGATQADAPAATQKALRDAMKILSDPRKYQSNLVGGGFLKAQIYVLWLHQEGAQDVMTNAQLNASGVPTGQVDILAAADSLLKLVEAVSPSCSAETLPWRQSKPWSEKINKAYTFLGAEVLDSAMYYADRAAILFPSSPFVHNAYAQIANKRGDIPAMLGHLRAAIIAAGSDTSLTTTKKQMQFQLAAFAQRQSLTAAGPDRAALIKEALDIYTNSIRESPASDDAAYSFQQASELIGATQDTAAAIALLAPMVADAMPYSDLTLLLAADVARFFGRTADAMVMYEGALKKNVNIRDANYFLAYLYYEAKKGEPMLPLTEKLIELDPSNGDNLQMKALAFQRMAELEKDTKKKAGLIKMMQDLSAQGEAMPMRLTITRFERRAEGAALGGNVENRGKVAKAYTVAVEFLDLQGAVIESMTALVASVKPGEVGTFELTATKAGVAAYRYAALK